MDMHGGNSHLTPYLFRLQAYKHTDQNFLLTGQTLEASIVMGYVL